MRMLANYKFGSKEIRKFLRQELIPANYSGHFHIFFIIATTTTFAGGSFYFVLDPAYWELTALPISFIAANFVEYMAHRFPMHRKIRYLEPLFSHLTIHHGFYATENRSHTYEEHRDFWALLLSGRLILILFGLGAMPVIVLAGVFISFNFAAVLNAGFWLYYLNYEMFHYVSHAPDNSLLTRIPGIRFIIKHHQLHHDPKLMSRYNFNITWPLCDWLFGTLYRERPK